MDADQEEVTVTLTRAEVRALYDYLIDSGFEPNEYEVELGNAFFTLEAANSRPESLKPEDRG